MTLWDTVAGCEAGERDAVATNSGLTVTVALSGGDVALAMRRA